MSNIITHLRKDLLLYAIYVLLSVLIIFTNKSVKKTVVLDYCIDVCKGGNDPIPRC